ncbi:amino acid permease [Corynebacterium striatum]|uniref:amino acid permease n=1 Tax=Corynebacterium striatum TaxID=43770 RepID=UPI0027B9F5B2|nr:amino acid permease [Corynebacterium striatum]
MTTLKTESAHAAQPPTTAKPVKGKAKKSDGSTWTWVITLFGTAVGAGILFLPMDAGSFGFWPLLAGTIIIGPLVFYSHRMFSRVTSASPFKDKDVLQVVSQLLGKTPGTLLAISYWMSIYPVVLIYAISITNTVDSFIVNQLNGPEINRTILSIVCVGILTGAFALGRKPMLWLSNALVYPLIISLATVSIYLIPHWDFSGFYETSTFHPWDFLKSLFLIMPVLIFSFSHEAAMSQFSLDMKKSYGANAEKQVSRVGRITVFLLVFFTMFFVWSCVLSMGADGIKTATEQNIPVLSYFANTANAPFMVWISPIIVLCAIITSYFGHMLGTEEGTKFLARRIAPKTANRFTDKQLDIATYIFVFITATLVSIFNPSVLDLISLVGGVFVALTVYVMPLFLFRTHENYAKFRGIWSNYFVFTAAIIVIITTILDLF